MFDVNRITVRKFELLEISGKLVTAEAYKLEDEIDKILAESSAINFIFDLRNLEYCSSYGLRIFIKVKKDLGIYDGVVILFRPGESFMKLLEIAGLEDYFYIKNDWNKIIDLLAEKGINL
jgi:anti-anti-sigma factor